MAVPKSPTGSTRSGNGANAMPREEVIARLEAVEARGETRFVELGGKLDYLTDVLVGDHGFFAQMNVLKADMTSLKADNKTTRWTIVITLITSIMAASALIVSVQANLLSAFQAGQTAASSARSTP
jgi:hypothetical protein